MIKTKKRKKFTRFRGTHTHGRGFKKKARGKGHRGGVGMAGTGKKADQKKTLILNMDEKYFGTQKRLAGRKINRIESVDLSRLVNNLDSLAKKGDVKESKGTYSIDLSGKKVLCTGELKIKLEIKALKASKKAIEKIKGAGGKIELLENFKEGENSNKE